jgi:hypothetical protein
METPLSIGQMQVYPHHGFSTEIAKPLPLANNFLAYF